MHSPWVAQILQLSPGRQTCLYTVMPLYQGELLETRLVRRPAIGLEEGWAIGVGLANGVAALHRLGVIHRDIKPDNVILEGGGKLKLVDLGVVRVPGWEDFPPEDIPGTPAYMAPEMFKGEAGSEATDIYALGVTMFRAFTGEFPYGNPDATSQPRGERPKDLAALRPDLPAWLGAVLGRAIAADPAERFRDAMEFAAEMEAGPPHAPAPARRPQTLLERAPCASGKVSPRCWRWRFSGRFFGGDRVNQHPPVLGRARPLCAHGCRQRGGERFGFTAGRWGKFAPSFSEITWKPATWIAAGSFRSHSGAIGCASAICGAGAREDTCCASR